MNTIETINISDVSLFAGTQVRTKPDEVAVIKYHEAMEEAGTNDIFPPILVFRDKNGDLWIADGHHRVQASIRSKLVTIVAEVRDGTKAEAIREAVIANRHNGVPLSKADRFKAMEMLLETSPELTDGALAELLGMPRKTVFDWRKQIHGGETATVTRTGKDGKKYPAKQNKKPKSSPVSPTSSSPAKPPQPTTSSQGSQPAQSCADTDEPDMEELYRRHDELWTESAERLKTLKKRFREFRDFYGDYEYQKRIHKLFDI